MDFSLGSTGGAQPRVHPPGATGLHLEFGSMGSTKAEKLIGTGMLCCEYSDCRSCHEWTEVGHFTTEDEMLKKMDLFLIN